MKSEFVKIDEKQWLLNKDNKFEHIRHLCNNHDPNECYCRGICSCHWTISTEEKVVETPDDL